MNNQIHYLGRQSRRFRLMEQLNTTTFANIIQSKSSTSLSLTMTNNIKSGNVMIVMVGWYSSNTTSSLSDNLGNVYTLIQSGVGVSATYIGLFIGIIKNGGSCTLTGVAAGSSFQNMSAVEFSNLLGIWQARGTSTSSNSSPTITLHGEGLAIAAIEGFHSSTTFSLPFPGIMITQINGNDACGIGIIQTGLSKTFSFGGSGLDSWLIAAATVI